MADESKMFAENNPWLDDEICKLLIALIQCEVITYDKAVDVSTQILVNSNN